MIYVLYLVYAVGNSQPMVQHLGTFESPETCSKAAIAYAQPRAFPTKFTNKIEHSLLKCRAERRV